MTELISDLEGLIFDSDFEALDKEYGVFCPFEAVGMVRQEIRHAHFLTYILDPNRPHGFESACLSALMNAVVRNNAFKGKLTALEIHLLDFEGAKIYREWNRVDLIIEIPSKKHIIAIELKIDARESVGSSGSVGSSESDGQLKRYKETVEKNWQAKDEWEHIFVFLTKNGDESTQEIWIDIELEELAVEFDKILSKEIGTPDAQSLLGAYLKMLRRHHLENENLAELARKLWEKHKEALEYLYKKRPSDNRTELLAAISESVLDLFKEQPSDAKSLTIVGDESTANIARFAVREWDKIQDFLEGSGWTKSKRLILIEVTCKKNGVFFKILLGKAEASIRKGFYDKLADAKVLKKQKEVITNGFTTLFNEKLLDFNESEDFEVDKISKIVSEKVKELIDTEINKFDRALRPQTP